MAQTIFPLLVNAPGKRLVQLAEGTHTIMMEKNRLELFKAVQASWTRGRRTDAPHSLKTSSRFRFTAGSTRITSSASDISSRPR